MRVKIGDEWFEPKENCPIMISLSPTDKQNLQNMTPENARYAVFVPDTEWNDEQKLEWMRRDPSM